MRGTKLPEKVNGKINLVAHMTTNHSLNADRGRGFMISCHILTNLLYKSPPFPSNISSFLEQFFWLLN
jgi:hypothetical protein